MFYSHYLSMHIDDDFESHHAEIVAHVFRQSQLQEMVAVQIAQEDPIRAELSADERHQLIALLSRAYAALGSNR